MSMILVHPITFVTQRFPTTLPHAPFSPYVRMSFPSLQECLSQKRIPNDTSYYCSKTLLFMVKVGCIDRLLCVQYKIKHWYSDQMTF